MKIIIINFIFIVSSLISKAQDPIRWDYSIKKAADKTYELHLTATMQYGWHLYSQKQPEDAIAVPTEIKFNNNPLLILNGKIKEMGKMEKHVEKTLGITQNQYSNRVDFVQQMKLKSSIKTNVVNFKPSAKKCQPHYFSERHA